MKKTKGRRSSRLQRHISTALALTFGLLLLCLLALSYLAAISAGQHTALAQSLVQIVKHRDLVIDLDRVK
jgi:hypothetical protein